MGADARLSLDRIAAEPGCLSAPVRLPDGTGAELRLLQPGDGDAFGRFLDELGETTRSLYAPHPLTFEHGRQLCAELQYAGIPTTDPATLRFIGTVPGEVVAYYILVLGVHNHTSSRYRGHGAPLDGIATCTFAPVVADAWQNRGVGTALVAPVLDAARRLGFARCVLMGGTRAINHRAIRFYAKAGFHKVGDFTTHAPDGTPIANHDMVLDL